jgi:hypothetical protein
MIVEVIFQMGVKSILEHVFWGLGLTVEQDCHGKLHIRGGRLTLEPDFRGERLTLEPDFRRGHDSL